jgi:hypothetical protein
MGGIYALERIAHDSASDRAAIADILTAYVRAHAPWPPARPGTYIADAPLDELPDLQVRAPEVQAILTVLGREAFADYVGRPFNFRLDVDGEAPIVVNPEVPPWAFEGELEPHLAERGGASIYGRLTCAAPPSPAQICMERTFPRRIWKEQTSSVRGWRKRVSHAPISGEQVWSMPGWSGQTSFWRTCRGRSLPARTLSTHVSSAHAW